MFCKQLIKSHLIFIVFMILTNHEDIRTMAKATETETKDEKNDEKEYIKRDDRSVDADNNYGPPVHISSSVLQIANKPNIESSGAHYETSIENPWHPIFPVGMEDHAWKPSNSIPQSPIFPHNYHGIATIGWMPNYNVVKLPNSSEESLLIHNFLNTVFSYDTPNAQKPSYQLPVHSAKPNNGLHTQVFGGSSNANEQNNHNYQQGLHVEDNIDFHNVADIMKRKHNHRSSYGK